MDSRTQKSIIRLLRRDSRISSSQMAERLGIDEATVQKTIKELEENHVVIGYSALINEDKLEDSPVRAIIEVEVTPQRDDGFDSIARRISLFPEVTASYLLSGNYDLLLEVSGSSLQEVALFVASRLSPIDGVKATRTHFLLKKYKEAGFILQEDEKNERLQISP